LSPKGFPKRRDRVRKGKRRGRGRGTDETFGNQNRVLQGTSTAEKGKAPNYRRRKVGVQTSLIFAFYQTPLGKRYKPDGGD